MANWKKRYQQKVEELKVFETEHGYPSEKLITELGDIRKQFVRSKLKGNCPECKALIELDHKSITRITCHCGLILKPTVRYKDFVELEAGPRPGSEIIKKYTEQLPEVNST